jgi:hypothetical protein
MLFFVLGNAGGNCWEMKIVLYISFGWEVKGCGFRFVEVWVILKCRC